MKSFQVMIVAVFFSILTLFRVAPLHAEEQAKDKAPAATTASATALSDEHFDETVGTDEDEYADDDTADDDEDLADEEEADDLKPVAGENTSLKDTNTATTQNPQEEEPKDEEEK